MVNAVGLGSSVGSLHEPSVCQTKQSLVYDLQEPFRWLIDVTVIQAFESGSLDVPHFYFTGDDYRYRFDVEAKRRFIGFLREQFNSGANYKGRVLKWGTVIEQKVTELSRFLIRKSSSLDFAEPSPKSLGYDARILRRRILSLTQFEARELGIGKSTLHYLRNRAQESPNFKSYQKTLSRLDLVG